MKLVYGMALADVALRRKLLLPGAIALAAGAIALVA